MKNQTQVSPETTKQNGNRQARRLRKNEGPKSNGNAPVKVPESSGAAIGCAELVETKDLPFTQRQNLYRKGSAFLLVTESLSIFDGDHWRTADEYFEHHPEEKLDSIPRERRKWNEDFEVLSPEEGDTWLNTAEDRIREGKLSELGLIILTDIYDAFTKEKYEDAITSFNGLGDLIAHHPSLQCEVAAIRQIVAGERVLNTLRARKHAL